MTVSPSWSPTVPCWLLKGCSSSLSNLAEDSGCHLCGCMCLLVCVCVCVCACVCPLAACVLASVCLQGCVCVWVCGLCFPSCMCVCVIVPVSSLCVCLCAPSCPGCVDFLRTMSLSFAQISKRRCPGGLLPPVAGRPSMSPSLFFLRSALE